MKSPKVSLENLPLLREKTERVSEYVGGRLRTHLATLYPLLAPKRIFGKYVGSRETVARADEAYRELATQYKDAAGAPFDLRSDLDEEALSAIEHGIEIYPWTYTHEVGGKKITIISPFRWAVSYRCDYTLAEMLNIHLGGGKDRRIGSVRHFVVNAVATQIALARSAGGADVLKDLRYEIQSAPVPGLGKLTMLAIGPALTSFLPPDDLLTMSIKLSGVPEFIELVDGSALDGMVDPFRTRIEELLKA